MNPEIRPRAHYIEDSKEVLSGLLEEPSDFILCSTRKCPDRDAVATNRFAMSIRHEENLRDHLIPCMRLASGHLPFLSAYWHSRII